MTENLNGLLHPPVAGPAPVQELTSILGDPAQHFQLDLDQAPQAIATFRQAAERMRKLMDKASRLADVPAPGLDAVSINAAKEIGQWALSEEPGSLRWALESGAVQLEKAAKALEQSLATYRNTDVANAAHLSRTEL
jgi:ABC-type transporter Mla subunit MlaD